MIKPWLRQNRWHREHEANNDALTLNKDADTGEVYSVERRGEGNYGYFVIVLYDNGELIGTL